MDVLKIFGELAKSAILITELIIFAKILLDNKKVKLDLRKIIIITISIVLYSVIIMTIDGTVKTTLLSILYIIIYKKLFKITFSESIFLVFLHAILMIISDLLTLFILVSLIKVSPEQFFNSYAGTITANLVVCILQLGLVYIFRRWLKKLLNIKIDNNRVIIIYTILTFGCIVVIFYNTFISAKFNIDSIISLLVMTTFVVILYSLIRQKIENGKIVEKYDKLLEFIKKYERAIEEQRTLRHESKNQLLTIKTKLIEKQVSNKIIEYIDSIINETIEFSEEKYGKFQYLPANGIKGLFYYKAMEAEDRGIKLSINISSKIEISILGSLDTEDFKQLGRIIGVYLDNAIEASSTSKNKKMGIEVYLHEEDVVIIIMNTYDGVIDTESVGKVRYSTKGKNRGYGLMLVSKILNANKRFIAETKITDKFYIQKLIIKKSI